MNEILAILLSERPLFITSEGYRQMVMAVLPYMKPSDAAELPKVKSFFFDPPTYKEECDKAVARLQAQIKACDETKAVQITNDFENQELPADTIGYHRVYGFITGDSRWCFSSKQLEQDLLAAERNPQICAHLMHINSSGGEAWYMDRLSETQRSLTKPVLTLCEGCMASAAYYIGCHGRKVYAVTNGDFIGSIGTMVSFHDFEPYYEKLGIKLIKAKADKSDLKNKMADNLIAGKPKQYIDEVLNPINEEFLSEVRSQRKALASMDQDHPVLRGEIYLTPRAQEVGLIDGTRTFPEAVAELMSMVTENREMSYILDHV
jgi:ClpP class serine protease